MTLRRVLLPAILSWGLLLLAGPVSAEVQRSTDQQGTIRIGNVSPAGQEKATDSQEKTTDKQGKTGEVSAQPGTASPEPPPPGLLPSFSRRTRTGPRGEVIPRPQSPLLSPPPSAPAEP